MACMADISVVQGLHQVAQKFTSTTFPRYWLKLCDLPSRSTKRKSSAVVPTAGTREPIAHTRPLLIASMKLSASTANLVELSIVFIVVSPPSWPILYQPPFSNWNDLVTPKM